MEMNFFIALRATRAGRADMIEQGGGAIVNVASVNAFFQPDGGVIDYGAAKAALVNLAKTLAQEFGPKGIRINCVSPGPVATDLWLGEDGVAGDGRRAPPASTRPAGARGHRAGIADRSVHDAGRGRDARRAARLGPDRERHRRQLRHRRRAHQDDLSRSADDQPPRNAEAE